jgi:molybdate transport system regulatory protein
MKNTRPRPDLSQALGHDVADKRIDILRRVHDSGSISQAARDAGVSYKAAWQAIETLGNLAGTTLVEKAVGGSGGGGAALTPAGLHLLQAADALASLRNRALAAIGQPGSLPVRLGLQTSMRNQFPAHVEALTRMTDAVRVRLALGTGTMFHSRITRESAQLLGLRPGLGVTALCKATAVHLHATEPPVADGSNLLKATLTRRPRAGSSSREATALLEAGAHIVGFLAQTTEMTDLGKNQPVWAEVDESAIVLAI